MIKRGTIERGKCAFSLSTFHHFTRTFFPTPQAPRGTKETLEEISEAFTQKKCSCSLYSPLLFSCHTLVFRDVSLDSIVGRKASCHEKPFCIFERSTERVKHRPSYPHSRHSRVFGLPASARAMRGHAIHRSLHLVPRCV